MFGEGSTPSFETQKTRLTFLGIIFRSAMPLTVVGVVDTVLQEVKTGDTSTMISLLLSELCTVLILLVMRLPNGAINAEMHYSPVGFLLLRFLL